MFVLQIACFFQQLEAEINVQWPELLSSAGAKRCDVLPLMLYRLAVCLDVYTEAVSTRLAHKADQDSQQFQKEKIFFRPAR